MIASTLGKTIEQITRDTTQTNTSHQQTRLIGVQRPLLHDQPATPYRCKTTQEIVNFARLQPDDLPFFLLVFQNLEKNIHEYNHICQDLRRIAESIGKLNRKLFFFHSVDDQQHQLDQMIATLSECFPQRTEASHWLVSR